MFTDIAEGVDNLDISHRSNPATVQPAASTESPDSLRPNDAVNAGSLPSTRVSQHSSSSSEFLETFIVYQ